MFLQDIVYFPSFFIAVSKYDAFGKPPFFDDVQSEVNACTESVGLVDMSSTGMFEIYVSTVE